MNIGKNAPGIVEKKLDAVNNNITIITFLKIVRESKSIGSDSKIVQKALPIWL